MDFISSKSDIELPRFIRDENLESEIDQLEEARRIYGPHVCYLTRPILESWAATVELPIKFIGLSGQSMYSPNTAAERKKELTIFKCVRVPEFEDDVDAPIIVDKHGVDWNARADYTDQEVMVTGSGDDPMFYFKRHAVIPAPVVPAPVAPAPAKPMNFMQGLVQAVNNSLQRFDAQNPAKNGAPKKGASRGKKGASKGASKGKNGAKKGASKGKKGASKGKKGASKGKKGANKANSKGSRKFKSTTNETKAELLNMLLRRKWSPDLLKTMSIHQLRVAAHVDRTWGVRNRKSTLTNETKAELRAFLKSRKHTNAELKGMDLQQLRKLAKKIRHRK